MNSKKRRREETRLVGNSQYALVPQSNIDVKIEVLEAMGKDCMRMKKELKMRSIHERNKRSQKCKFVLGTNAVTRALERDELELVVVCGRAKSIFTQHLPLLCARKQCKWHTTGKLSCESMGKYFGLKRLSSFGLVRQKLLTSGEGGTDQKNKKQKKM